MLFGFLLGWVTRSLHDTQPSNRSIVITTGPLEDDCLMISILHVFHAGTSLQQGFARPSAHPPSLRRWEIVRGCRIIGI